ncbi:2-keto-4-pentenoate hydratase [Novosphingobium sp. 9]|uniref:2-keto-4-pentenoate hydratase n=1 Tax=Novosphingobium sp. 9 TaxID=2025349 RepID=UPI0021B587FA|nr:2-keto-4-pentenoate hydratase [Novosphingobium sp. 9]
MDGYSKSDSGPEVTAQQDEARKGASGTEQAIAAAFVAARRSASALDAYPGALPEDLAAGYRIQDTAIALDGREVVGWKVGRIPPPRDIALGADRLCGPIFADEVVTQGAGSEPEMPVFAGGFAAAEAEFLLHVVPGWDGVVPTDDAATAALIDAVHIGIEIASSPWARINADGPPVTVSDFGNNAGMIVGPAFADWQEIDFSCVPVSLEIDGVVAGEGTTATMLDGPLGAVRFLLANLVARGQRTEKGLWVSSGAVTGVHEVRPGAQVRARFAGWAR